MKTYGAIHILYGTIYCGPCFASVVNSLTDRGVYWRPLLTPVQGCVSCAEGNTHDD